MAKKSWIAREKKRRKLAQKYEARRRALKEAGDFEGLQRLPRNSSPVRQRNRCGVTGRSRGYMRHFGVSRMAFRQMALEGKIPGIRKASW